MEQRFRGNRGVTLIEMAVVIFIIALLLGTILGPLSVQIRQREMRDAALELRAVRDALISFAQTRGRLPCPDTTRDGQGNGTPPTCAAITGYLPFAELGIRPTDRWGRLYVYRVAPSFTNPTSPGLLCDTADDFLGTCDVGDIEIKGRGDDPATPLPQREYKSELPLTTTAAAIVLSTGPNGHCGTLPDGIRQAAPDGGACPDPLDPSNPLNDVIAPDEMENTDADNVFVARDPSEERDPASCSDISEGPPLCEYDDLAEWITASFLLGKLIEAGQLP